MSQRLRVLGWVTVVACGADEEERSREDSGAPITDGCAAASLESDFGFDPSLGDPASWVLPPTARVSTTYLRIDGDAGQAAFDDLIGPVTAELIAAPGLLGVSLGGSASCGTARTLSAWVDDAAMMAFVTGPAHLAAIERVGEVSRGGSITAVYPVDELPALDWATVVGQLARHEGPVY